MDLAHQEAHAIINEHREQLNVIAEKLLEVETLDASEIKSLFETGQMPTPVDSSQEDLETPGSYEEVKRRAEDPVAARGDQQDLHDLRQASQEQEDQPDHPRRNAHIEQREEEDQ